MTGGKFIRRTRFSKWFALIVSVHLATGMESIFAEDTERTPAIGKKFRLSSRAKDKKEEHSGPTEAREEHQAHSEGDSLELSDTVINFRDFGRDIPGRPRTLTEVIEDRIYPENVARSEMLANREPDDVETEVPERKSIFGKDRFLSPGPIDPGIKSPTGATWRPSFLIFGNIRTAVQSYEAPGGERTSEWANRLDIFGNLSLNSTERFVFGFRPLDEEGDFTGVAYGRGVRDEGFVNGFDPEPHTFFFEGYLDELFPNFDPTDSRGIDIGYSLGRQPIILQDGILANDNMDALGLTKHNMFLLGSSNARLSAYAGFNEIHRGDNIRDSRARLFAINSQFDYPDMTIEADAAFVKGSSSLGGDGLYFGLGHIQQFGYWNSALRLNTSIALDKRSSAISDGWLISHALARKMKHSDDVLTLSSFGEIDNYTSAARGPATGGPLGGISLLQRAVGIGSYGSPIEVADGDLLGFEISYQHFLDSEEKRQILISAGGAGTYDPIPGRDDFTAAIALQYQHALSSNLVWSLGSFGSITDDDEKGFGLRTELQRKF